MTEYLNESSASVQESNVTILPEELNSVTSGDGNKNQQSDVCQEFSESVSNSSQCEQYVEGFLPDVKICEDLDPNITNTESIQSSQIYARRSFLFDNVEMLTGAWKEFSPKSDQKEIFLKGCKWSPDGTCLLTNSNDATMRLFNLPFDLYNCQQLSLRQYPELTPSLTTKVLGLVYDYAWYPLMTSANPQTCCFVTTSFASPIQMWDAFTGKLRSSYLGYNFADEMTAALSVTFNPSGDSLFCGYKDCIRIFNTDIPGKDSTFISTKELSEQKGIVSCIAVNPSMPNIFAAGTYTKTIGLYSVDGHALCLMTGQVGGLTQVEFSMDGSRLFSAGRKDSEILCWDLRYLGKVLFVIRRPHLTNQRIYFDISNDDRYLLSGSTDGIVRVWDLQLSPTSPDSGQNSVLEPVAQWRAHNDCVNGISVHRHIPVIATASGQRFVPELVDDDDDDLVFQTKRPQEKYEDSVKLWWAGPVSR